MTVTPWRLLCAAALLTLAGALVATFVGVAEWVTHR